MGSEWAAINCKVRKKKAENEEKKKMNAICNNEEQKESEKRKGCTNTTEAKSTVKNWNERDD